MESYFCGSCYEAIQENVDVCPICFAKKETFINREAIFPRGDSQQGFKCPTQVDNKRCNTILSSDLLYSQDTRCPSCRNKLEFCDKCHGMKRIPADMSGLRLYLLDDAQYWQVWKKYCLLPSVVATLFVSVFYALKTSLGGAVVLFAFVLTASLIAGISIINRYVPKRRNLSIPCSKCNGTGVD